MVEFLKTPKVTKSQWKTSQKYDITSIFCIREPKCSHVVQTHSHIHSFVSITTMATPREQKYTTSQAQKNTSWGEDCERPACDDMVSMLKQAQARKGLNPSAPLVPQELDEELQTLSSPSCPPNSAELGRSSWTLLHSMVRQHNRTTTNML